MRLLILILAVAFILAGCGEAEEVPVEEPESAETEKEEAQTDTAKAVDEKEGTEAEETSTDKSSKNRESEDESDKAESEAETESAAEPAEAVNVMDGIEVVAGYWINYSGEDNARSHMTRTNPIEYNAGQDYTVTAASYVSYFYGDEFIKTNNYGHNGPHIIESVPEADRVIVSFSEPEKDIIQLMNEASEKASAGNELNSTPDELIGRGQPVEEEIKGTIMFDQDFLTGDKVFTGERIDDKGNFVDDESYYVTGALAYKPSEDYIITSPAYISYYNGRRFIETVEITAVPAYLPEVKDANYINISFHDDYLLDLNIIELE